MKRKILLLPLLVLTVAACRQQAPQPQFVTLEGSRSFLLTADEPIFSEDIDTVGVRNSYSLVWPAEGLLTPEAECALVRFTFGDSSAATFQQAAEDWLECSWAYEEDGPILHKHPVDSLADTLPSTYARIESHTRLDSNLLTFVRSSEYWAYYAAHGLHETGYFTVDLATGRVVTLSDLCDTALLPAVIVRAVEDLVVNRPVLDCLSDDYRGASVLPQPDDFYIDSTRSTIVLVYQIYSIAPYACGSQAVVLPIFWLSKHLPLTPYARQLFGPEAYLPEE